MHILILNIANLETYMQPLFQSEVEKKHDWGHGNFLRNYFLLDANHYEFVLIGVHLHIM